MKSDVSFLNDCNFPLLTDGGLSNELERMGYHLDDPLWTAKLLNENPEAIIKAHQAYLEAGADIIITSSYQASYQGLVNVGFSDERAIELLLSTVSIAETAIKRFENAFNQSHKKLIGASIGPYGAFLADGSEYSGNYKQSVSELVSFYLPTIEILSQTNADFFACETLPSLKDAEALSALIRRFELPAWFSFSCQDEVHLNDGTALREVANLLTNNPWIFAIGINCTHPDYVNSLINEIRRSDWDRKIVVYPNSGEAYNASDKSWSGPTDPLICAMESSQWIDLGADIIGGCCRMGPDHISAMRSIIVSKGGSF